MRPHAPSTSPLHHDLFFFIVVIFFTVSWVFGRIVYGYNVMAFFDASRVKLTSLQYKYFSGYPVIHHTNLEFFWTLLPSLILVSISLPTFTLIYSLEDVVVPQVFLKVIGHQWYWSYEFDRGLEYDDFESCFDSYMIATDDLDNGFVPDGTTPHSDKLLSGEMVAPKLFRLLEVDREVILPVKTHVRLLITAADVLHSWAVPSLGVKMDACPGRLNQVNLFISRAGVFYGQCSELCGINHGFMPIVVRSVWV